MPKDAVGHNNAKWDVAGCDDGRSSWIDELVGAGMPDSATWGRRVEVATLWWLLERDVGWLRVPAVTRR